MSLTDLDLYEAVFGPFRERRVGLITFDGNVGDRLIDTATVQLLRDYHINYRLLTPDELASGTLNHRVDAILISGGGNMGGMYPGTREERRRVLIFGVPVTVLPQTFTDAHEDIAPFAKVFVRERTSLKLAPGTTLAPDLALGLRPPWTDEGVEAETGVWLRQDRESKVSDPGVSLGDPSHISRRVEDYLGLASKFEHIVTDRLHFAIAGLLVGRRVTLLPNVYFKNRAMYDTWLRDFGCRWRYRADGIKCDRDETAARLWRRFAVPPSALVAWESRPVRSPAWEMSRTAPQTELRGADGASLQLNAAASLVWSLCDGTWSVEDLCRALAEHYNRPLPAMARDVQGILRKFRQQGAVEKDLRPQSSPPSPESRAPVPRFPDRHIRVEVLAPRKQQGRLRWSARVQGTRRGDFLHWFECDPRWRDALTTRADPFVLALLPRAMKDGLDLRVSGAPVDVLLLERLDEYQRAWQAWRPEQARPLAIHAQEVVVRGHSERPALAAFSGGVDSLYTVFRHCLEPDGHRHRKLEAVLMGLGFDIPVNDRNGYRTAVQRLRPALDEATLPLIEVASNIRTHLPDWEIAHGAALASALSLFSNRFGAGVIPSTAPYRLLFPWGSNPITDPLLGGAFEIIHDSAAMLRFEKLKTLTRWPAAIQRLRVCWWNRDPAHNCGRCAKCFQLSMGLQALRAPLDCFNETPSTAALAEFASHAILSHLESLDLSCILNAARAISLEEPWVASLSDRFAPPAVAPAPEQTTEFDPTPEAST